LASPHEPTMLALGYLANEGVLHHRDQVWDIHVVAPNLWVWLAGAAPASRPQVRTTGCGQAWTSAAPEPDPAGTRAQAPARACVDPERVLAWMRTMAREARGYAVSGGLHAAALVHPQAGLRHLAEDVGRHNAVDRLRGWALWTGHPTQGHWLLVSGRISSEMVTKAVAMGVALLVSRTAATARALRLARGYGLPVITYARGGRLRAYGLSPCDAAQTQSPMLSSTMTK